MTDSVLLPEDILRSVEEIGEVDILIGIPSYNNARTIGHVVKAVKAGLAKYFPQERCIIVNSDGGSTDGTPEIVAKTTLTEFKTILIHHPLYPIHKITIYDFAIAYHRRTLSHEHLIKSLIPLYLGKTASFVIETQEATSEDVEEVFERLCLRFEEEKGYLIEAWE